ncbi:50S ribosomal protein L22 [Patescibacteria group bacterium]|nr:50S ribosomal protein L22 [Patescibacteria group bacterium]
MVEVKAKLKHVRISPKKMRLVADLVRGLTVTEAFEKLPVTFKRSAPIISKLLKSAVANAIDRYDVKEEDLRIKSIIVNQGVDLKRWKPAAFGRAHPYKKHSSHVEIMLVTKEGVKATLKDKKKEEVETVDLTKTDKKPTTKVDNKKSAKPKEEKKSFKETKMGKAKDNSKVKKG